MELKKCLENRTGDSHAVKIAQGDALSKSGKRTNDRKEVKTVLFEKFGRNQFFSIYFDDAYLSSAFQIRIIPKLLR